MHGRTERVERMDRTEEPAGAGTARAGAARAMTVFSAADEEKRRGVRRMKLTAAGLLLFVAVVYVLAEWAAHRGRARGRPMWRRPRRRAWSVRSPTGSR